MPYYFINPWEGLPDAVARGIAIRQQREEAERRAALEERNQNLALLGQVLSLHNAGNISSSVANQYLRMLSSGLPTQGLQLGPSIQEQRERFIQDLISPPREPQPGELAPPTTMKTPFVPGTTRLAPGYKVELPKPYVPPDKEKMEIAKEIEAARLGLPRVSEIRASRARAKTEEAQSKLTELQVTDLAKKQEEYYGALARLSRRSSEAVKVAEAHADRLALRVWDASGGNLTKAQAALDKALKEDGQLQLLMTDLDAQTSELVRAAILSGAAAKLIQLDTARAMLQAQFQKPELDLGEVMTSLNQKEAYYRSLLTSPAYSAYKTAYDLYTQNPEKADPTTRMMASVWGSLQTELDKVRRGQAVLATKQNVSLLTEAEKNILREALAPSLPISGNTFPNLAIPQSDTTPGTSPQPSSKQQNGKAQGAGNQTATVEVMGVRWKMPNDEAEFVGNIARTYDVVKAAGKLPNITPDSLYEELSGTFNGLSNIAKAAVVKSVLGTVPYRSVIANLKPEDVKELTPAQKTALSLWAATYVNDKDLRKRLLDMLK